MISISLEMHSLQLDRLAQTVIRNNANNRSQHISGYYKQTDGALPGWMEVWWNLRGSGKRRVMSLNFFPAGEFRHRTILMEFWLNSSGRQRFHLEQPQECLKYDIWRIIHLLHTIKRNTRNCINKHKIKFSSHKQLPLPSFSLFDWNKWSVWLMCSLTVVEDQFSLTPCEEGGMS